MIENNLLSLSYGAIVRKDINGSDGLLPESFETYQIVEPDDIVWRLTDLQNDKRSLRTAIVRERGIITSAYLATKPSGVSPVFLHYLLRAYDHQKVFYSMGGGLRQSMKYSDVRRLPLVLPPPDEQTTITAFLDRETAKIDALIEEKRRLIELLKEKRQAILSHAVTKGLDPTVPMKDSGVEWLGEVPAHWEVVAIKRLACLQSGEAITSDSIEDVGPFPVFGGNGLRGFSERHTHEGEFVLIGRQGALCGNINYAIGRFWASEHAIVAHPLRSLATSWFGELLRTMNLGRYSMSAAQPGLAVDMLGNLRCPYPPHLEQLQIAAEIDRVAAEIEPLIAEAASAIGFLQERRSALISAAVTGKINVNARMVETAEGECLADLRLLVGAEIIGALATKPTFGRVKFQKLMYLAEAHVGITELEGDYRREAAGPLDRALVEDIEHRLVQAGHIGVSQPHGSGGRVDYRLLGGRDPYSAETAEILGDRAAGLRALIALFADLDTRSTEAVTTLYAVWNDALIDGRRPTTSEIVAEVLNDWHPEKAEKFRTDQLEIWLGWMRRNSLEPRGSAPRTRIGRLFA